MSNLLKEIKLRERLAHAYNSLATAYEKASEDGIPQDVVRAIETETEDRVFTDRATQYAAKVAAQQPGFGEIEQALAEALGLNKEAKEPANIDEIMADFGKHLEEIFGAGQVKVKRLDREGKIETLFGGDKA